VKCEPSKINAVVLYNYRGVASVLRAPINKAVELEVEIKRILFFFDDCEARIVRL